MKKNEATPNKQITLTNNELSLSSLLHWWTFTFFENDPSSVQSLEAETYTEKPGKSAKISAKIAKKQCFKKFRLWHCRFKFALISQMFKHFRLRRASFCLFYFVQKWCNINERYDLPEIFQVEVLDRIYNCVLQD